MRGFLTIFFVVIVVLIVVALAVSSKGPQKIVNRLTPNAVDNVLSTSDITIEDFDETLENIDALDQDLAAPNLQPTIDL